MPLRSILVGARHQCLSPQRLASDTGLQIACTQWLMKTLDMVHCAEMCMAAVAMVQEALELAADAAERRGTSTTSTSSCCDHSVAQPGHCISLQMQAPKQLQVVTLSVSLMPQ